MFARLVAAGALTLVLAGCIGPRVSETEFLAGASLEPQAFSNLSVAEVDVKIPEDMPVSTDPNLRYPPPKTLVWWEDPPGDRKAQVSRLVAEAVKQAADRQFTGTQPVRIEVMIDQFHAMTPLARASSWQYGVHEVRFDIVIRDAASDEVIAAEENLSADLRAFSGNYATLAEYMGQTQAVRIKARIEQVITDWLRA